MFLVTLAFVFSRDPNDPNSLSTQIFGSTRPHCIFYPLWVIRPITLGQMRTARFHISYYYPNIHYKTVSSRFLFKLQKKTRTGTVSCVIVFNCIESKTRYVVRTQSYINIILRPVLPYRYCNNSRSTR